MLKETYILPSNDKTTIDVLWVGNWKITVIECDGRNIGCFTSIKELKGGREFILNDNEKVFIKLKGLFHPKLELFYNGNEITNSSKLPENVLKQTYNLVFLIGIESIVAGVAPFVFKKGFYSNNNFVTLILGGIVLLLSVRVKKNSRISLLLICILILSDILFSLYQIQSNGRYIIFAMVKALILYSLIDGYKAMKKVE